MEKLFVYFKFTYRNHTYFKVFFTQNVGNNVKRYSIQLIYLDSFLLGKDKVGENGSSC